MLPETVSVPLAKLLIVPVPEPRSSVPPSPNEKPTKAEPASTTRVSFAEVNSTATPEPRIVP